MTGKISRRTMLKAFGAAAGAATVLGASGEFVSNAVAVPVGSSARTGTYDGLSGRIVRPGDEPYESARQGWDALFSSYPSVIVFAQEPDDVVNALTWARAHDTALRVRSGRHPRHRP